MNIYGKVNQKIGQRIGGFNMSELLGNQILFIFLSVLCLTLASIGLICGAVALIKVIAMEKSTHTMQYVSPEEIIKNNTKEENTAPWATDSLTIEEQNKLYKEDLEASGFDAFIPDEDDKKIHSF